LGVAAFFVLQDQAPLTLALSRRERGLTAVSLAIHRPERSSRLWIQSKAFDLGDTKSVMDSQQIVQVGVDHEYPPIGPLYLWERARVRASGLKP
jgi:hypothetical protein